MTLRKQAIALQIKNVLGLVQGLILGRRFSCDDLYVVNYHSTPKRFMPSFEKQLVFFNKYFKIIDPGDLQGLFEKKYQGDKPRLLITFDDGLRNNLNAVNALNKYGIKAVFFVVPAFIDCAQSLMHDFYRKNIRPDINYKIERDPEDFFALSWSELRDLKEAGHDVGSHTYTHNMTQGSTLENSEFEILRSKDKIGSELNIPVKSFCSINNTLQSVGAKEKKLIDNAYTFHFTTIPGANIPKKPLFIKRRNVEVYWPLGAVYYALSPLDDLRWAKKIQLYDQL